MKYFDFTKQDREDALIQSIDNLSFAMMTLALAFQPTAGNA